MFGFRRKKHLQKFYTPGQELKFGKADIASFSGEKDAVSVCHLRTLFVIFAFVSVYFVICLRLIVLCTSDDLIDTKKANADKKSSGFEIARVIRRADITDRNGTILATSLNTHNLYKKGKDIENPEEIASELADIIPDLSYNSILKKLKSKKSFNYIKRNLTPTQVYQINALGHRELEFEKAEKRIYPLKNLFSHIVGYTDTESHGIAGIEKQLDERLISSDISLKLSLDSVVQDIVHEELSAAIEKFHALGGVSIVMDVHTAEVIAMVSLPDFDPNFRKFKTQDAMKNFATEGTYEAGSVFKIFTAALGLKTGKISLTETFDTTNPIKFKYNTIRGYHEERRPLTVGEVLIYSSNLGSARIALKVGQNEQKKFLESLGFFEKVPNIEVPERAFPITPKRWGEETTATVAYGYGISSSPLHIITAFCSIVNGGIYNEPTLLADTHNRKSYRVISQKTSESMRKLLRDVVVKGSGKNANVKGYEVAGKTGTADKIIDGKYIKKAVRTSFVSTFPSSDPKYAVFVMLDEPKGLKETFNWNTSGWNSVPTAGKIIERIAPQLNVQANFLLEEQKQHIIEASYH